MSAHSAAQGPAPLSAPSAAQGPAPLSAPSAAQGPAPLPGGARQATLRESNLRAVLRIVCASADDLARAGVASRLGSTRATAGRLVDELVAGGLLVERDRHAAGGRPRGRPAMALAPTPTVVALGLQVDTDRVEATVMALDGTEVARRTARADLAGTPAGEALAHVRQVADDALAATRGLRVVGAALAVPGLVAHGRQVLRAPNLGWFDVDVAADLGPLDGLGGLVHVGNEADLIATSIVHERPGRSVERPDLVLVSGSHGIGGAVVRGGRVESSALGGAGEVGHVCVDPSGPRCPCGSRGCLEQYAGLDALAAASGVLPAEVADLGGRADDGDETAQRVLERLTWALSIALGGVMNVVGLDIAVLGGHLGRLEPAIGADLRDRLATRVLRSPWSPVTVRAAGDAPDAAARGAALRALDTVLAEPTAWL